MKIKLNSLKSRRQSFAAVNLPTSPLHRRRNLGGKYPSSRTEKPILTEARGALKGTAASLNEVVKLVDSVNLPMVKLKIMDKEEGQGWDQEYADSVERRYRRYLCMILMKGGKGSVVPTKEIDLFWHQHILDTRAYADDCQKIFGKFIHHFPYFGMRDEEDAKNLLSAFEETKITYARLFGEDYSRSDASNCHKCADTSNCKDTISCKRCKSD